jgi:1,4-dihydroxy-2-naphthoate octaprenyltransferase
MNEVPDVAADSAVGKRTLAVRLGTGGTRRLYVALQVLAVLAFLGAGALGIVPWWAAIASLAFLPIALRAARGIVSPERDRLKASIEATLALHTIGCAALIVAILLGLL